MDYVTILYTTDGKRLNKRIERSGADIKISPYQNAKFHRVETRPVSSIADIADVLDELSSIDNAAIVRGRLRSDVDPLDQEIRRTLRAEPISFEPDPSGHHWVMIDFDRVALPVGMCPVTEGPEYLVRLLPPCFWNAAYVIQWSSSAGFTNCGPARWQSGWSMIKAHIWFWLDQPWTDEDLSGWMKFESPDGKIFDPRLAHTVQLHYTAAPTFVGVTDPVLDRVRLVRKVEDAVALTYMPPIRSNTTRRAAASTSRSATSIATPQTEGHRDRWNTAAMTAAIEEWRRAPEGEGDQAFFILASKLAGAGMGEFECEGVLVEEAQGARNPDQRLDQIDRILNWLRVRDAFDHPHDGLLDRHQTRMTINVLNAKCGEGKSFQMMTDIVQRGGVWVYAVDKITTIEDAGKGRKPEFHHCLAAANRQYRFLVREAHSQSGTGLSVGAQISAIFDDIEGLARRNAVVFVTHEALFLVDWRRWRALGAHVVMDEVTDVITTGTNDFTDTADVVRPLFEIDTDDGEAYRVSLSAEGRDKLRSNRFDEMTGLLRPLMRQADKPNSNLFVTKASWDAAGSQPIEWFTLKEPTDLTAFNEVWLLGDHATRSILYHVWSNRAEIDWVMHSIRHPRQRTVPIRDRAIIRYFCETDRASFARFDAVDRPLSAISKWLAVNEDLGSILWTTNDRPEFRGQMHLPGATFITPKAHGRNDLMHLSVMVWMSAIRTSFANADLIKRVCGLGRAEIDEWQEYNALYQFAMRGVLRQFDSAVPSTLYVFDRRQAEYLSERLDGARIEHVPNVVRD
ncbi:MAG: hypothetical protein ACK5YI_17820, partial [Rhodospirillales bacterium]